MKHRVACAGIAALVLAVPVASARIPQLGEEGCEITPIECDNIPHLESGSWVPGTMTWKPNRLPAAVISFRTGNYCSGTAGNYSALQGWWYDQDYGVQYDDGDNLDPIDELRNRIIDAYGSGYRRIILNLPAGSVRSQDFPASQWWPIPQSKREQLACLILNWLGDHADTQFEVYAGFPINDPESLCMSESNFYTEPTIEAGTCATGQHGYMYYPCAGADTAHSPSPFVQADVCDFYRSIDPWRQLGITRYWLDGSTAHWSDYIELAYCPLYAPGEEEHHFLGAEAFPLIFDDPNPSEVDIDRALLSPAIIFPDHIAGQDQDQSWNISAYAGSTELVVIVDYTLAYFDADADFDFDMYDVLSWTQRGFVLAAQSSVSALVPPQFTEYMKRVYDFGILSNRRDFN